MKIKCEYCDNFVEDTEEQCPNCGAPNSNMIRSGIGVPKTIEELQAFCREHQIPLEKARFFIGENYVGPRAFGIYREEGGNVVVYKNKSDGSRSVRYRGSDEAYAVNEIYQKLKAEVLQRKNAAAGTTASPVGKATGRTRMSGVIIGLIVLVAIVLFIASGDNTPNDGYYYYDDYGYYFNSGSWYQFDDAQQEWLPADSVDEELNDSYSDYWAGDSYSGDSNVSDFSDSDYYSITDDEDWANDWDDDDFDWDNGSDWDSGASDWDSDW
ncbi:MAG: hypothetical protein Q4C04_02575 [Clostridia bacterium]|nr:hypothetical protein [Clostridia bacterium]